VYSLAAPSAEPDGQSILLVLPMRMVDQCSNELTTTLGIRYLSWLPPGCHRICVHPNLCIHEPYTSHRLLRNSGPTRGCMTPDDRNTSQIVHRPMVQYHGLSRRLMAEVTPISATTSYNCQASVIGMREPDGNNRFSPGRMGRKGSSDLEVLEQGALNGELNRKPMPWVPALSHPRGSHN
jgi:hypothetical protein